MPPLLALPAPRLRRAVATAAALATLLSPLSGAAQDLNRMALDWARGQFASPVVCEVADEPVRALRRVLIAPGPSSERSASNRISFPDPEAEGATRCFSDLGEEEPLVKGFVVVTLPGASRPDLARVDFQNALRRDGGFRFDVLRGRLEVQGWSGPEAGQARPVDFGGGTATLRRVQPGSDLDRRLREYRSPRKLALTLEAPDGTRLAFPLFQHGLR